MTLSDEIKTELIQRLQTIDPEKVVLFGSQAWGTPSAESDIDLYVVTKDDFMPSSWREKKEIYLRVARSIRDFSRRYPTDLIVHTKPMHQKFIETNSSFSREISLKGLSLYESN